MVTYCKKRENNLLLDLHTACMLPDVNSKSQSFETYIVTYLGFLNKIFCDCTEMSFE